MNRRKLSYLMALSGYFGLYLCLMLWYAWLLPSPSLPRAILLLLAVGPLMVPLMGLMRGKLNSFAWSLFLALGYFVLGVYLAAASESRSVGLLVSACSILFFTGAMLYVRWQARWLKQQQTLQD